MLFFGKRLNQDDTLRMQGLFIELRRKRESIGIPAQVWAEFIEQAGQAEVDATQNIFRTAAFKFLNYDLRASLETVEVVNTGRSARKNEKGEKRPRQAVKVDWQIIAIAKAHNARLLITNDVDMASEARRSGLSCLSIRQLQIPEDLRQHQLDLKKE